ncbi:cyclic GMP-AMP synthase-like receptor isoform X1 [Haemaphysalis longicornis]
MATHKEARAALDDVLKALALNKRTSQRNKKTLDLLLKGLTETMKEVDPLFRKLYQRLAYTGSMYQKLRIFNPDEFDIDIVLFFPLPKGCASPEVSALRSELSYISAGCETPLQKPGACRHPLFIVDED